MKKPDRSLGNVVGLVKLLENSSKVGIKKDAMKKPMAASRNSAEVTTLFIE